MDTTETELEVLRRQNVSQKETIETMTKTIEELTEKLRIAETNNVRCLCNSMYAVTT